jgi:hypothetical protein
MTETEAFIREIEDYCRQTNTAESTFGRRAVNDGKFVTRLREGKSVTLKTLNRVRVFMHNYPPEAGAGAVAATRPDPGDAVRYTGSMITARNTWPSSIPAMRRYPSPGGPARKSSISSRGRRP